MNQLSQNLTSMFRDGLALLRATLREVFDESAYARFLQRNQMIPSSQSYAAFQLENDRAKARRPRCC